MYETPPVEHEKKSLDLVGGFLVTLAGIIVAYTIISVIGLILRFAIGLQFVGLLSPFYEEPLKAIGLIALALFFPGTFKSKKEGAILGALAGILFGIVEIFDFSILYQSYVSAGLMSAASVGMLLIVRTFTSLPMHAIASLLFGLGVAYAAMSAARPRLEEIFSGNSLTFIILAVGFHLVYNLFGIVPSLALRMSVLGLILGFAVMLAGLYMAYRIYDFIPGRLERLPPIGARELLRRAMGWEARKGAAVPDKRP